ncbi:protein MAIN-LIKE 1-like [Vigna umbellata]|uniref:protein MAIN-LIKE 1-like n=1 Tax=Vigna umbellata TaxID=87088 RepID=UPI001F5FD9C5|nr:protein MAIN-LIKE 1-like [Vigna umbellata]
MGAEIVKEIPLEQELEDTDAAGERWRPTASARRRRGVVESDIHVEDHGDVRFHEDAVENHAFEEHDIEQEEDHEDVVEGGFPRGQLDALEREEIKLISPGKKLNKLGSCHEGIRDIVNSSGLMSLVGMSYDYVDRGLLLAFVEIFHFETNSFHLPVEEVNFEESRRAIVELLGVDGGRAGAELQEAHGAKVILSWLRDIYAEHCEQDVHACGRYAWGVAALAYMYEQLGDANLASIRQMTGYLTLLQSWIYERFPTLGRRCMVSSYMEDRPRAAKWESPRQGSTLLEVRVHLDALTYDSVIWYPYESHRETCPFYDICIFSGWIRIGEMLCRHLPQRVLRQFGFHQSIPRDPPVVADADILATDDVWLHYRDHVVMGLSVCRFPYDCLDGYLPWFRMISHPYIIHVVDDDRLSLAPRL